MTPKMKTTILRISLLILVLGVLTTTFVSAGQFEFPEADDYVISAPRHLFLYIAAAAWVCVTGWVVATHRRYRIPQEHR